MNTLYLRIPTHLVTAWPNSILAYALCAKDGAILSEGQAKLAELAKLILKSKIVLLIAASDVTLLGITIPPAIPEAKLKVALPNLVEDQLMSDSADCVLLLLPKQASADDANKRVVAVVERNWLQQLSTSLYALGASYVKAVPAQLCLPYKSGHCSVLIEQFGQEDLSVHYSLRLAIDRGVGILLEFEQSIEKRLSSVVRLSPPGPIWLQLPKELMGEYKTAIENNTAWADQITIHEVNWLDTIDAIKQVGTNLMVGLNLAHASRVHWKIWRWPLMLASLILLINIVGLNGEYWAMKREVQALKLGMVQTYKVSFPKDAVVAFPLEQMKKNLEIAQRNAGQAAPYDFTALITELGAAWGTVESKKLPKIISIEYKNYALLVQVKGNMPQEELGKVLSAKGLSMKKSNAEVWEIKVAE